METVTRRTATTAMATAMAMAMATRPLIGARRHCQVITDVQGRDPDRDQDQGQDHCELQVCRHQQGRNQETHLPFLRCRSPVAPSPPLIVFARSHANQCRILRQVKSRHNAEASPEPPSSDRIFALSRIKMNRMSMKDDYGE
jgi:hypothetical protein